MAGVEQVGSFELTEEPADGQGRVFFQTVHAFKGLDRPVVVFSGVFLVAFTTGFPQ